MIELLCNRYFVADNVFDEITFGLPRQKTDIKTKQLIATRLEKAITSVLFTLFLKYSYLQNIYLFLKC